MFDRSYVSWYLKRKFRKRNIRTGGHSQYGQDLISYQLLNRPESGVFVDIGANDGVTFSNSLLFEQKGWTGVCVEPHPEIFKSLSSSRKCHLLNACISESSQPVQFIAVQGESHMLSGVSNFIDERHLDRIRREVSENNGSVTEATVGSIRPNDLLKKFGIADIDFLSIDTEGCELPILQNIDFDKHPVKCICVENGSRSSQIFQFLTTLNFRLAMCVGCDEIYLS